MEGLKLLAGRLLGVAPLSQHLLVVAPPAAGDPVPDTRHVRSLIDAKDTDSLGDVDVEVRRVLGLGDSRLKSPCCSRWPLGFRGCQRRRLHARGNEAPPSKRPRRAIAALVSSTRPGLPMMGMLEPHCYSKKD